MALPRKKREIKEQYPIFYTQPSKAFPELNLMDDTSKEAYKKEIAAGLVTPQIKGYAKVQPSYVPHRLLLIAALKLMEPEDALLESLYYKHKFTPGVYFESCKTGVINPCNNETQKLFRSYFPTAKKVHLYIGLYKNNEPTHYITLKKIDFKGQTFFIPSNRRVIPLSSDRPTRSGVIAVLFNPVPREAVLKPIRFERIITGGAGISLLHAELSVSYELQRQLTHCLLVGYLSDTLKEGKFSVRLHPGRLDLMPTIDPEDFLAFTGVNPFRFDYISSREYAPDVERYNCTIYADAIDLDFDRCNIVPRLILPKIKPGSYTLVEDIHQEFSTWLAFAISEILKWSRLFPFVGVKVGNSRSITFYALSYNPDNSETNLVKLKNKKESYCQDLPFIASSGENHYPSYAMALAFKTILLTPVPPSKAHQARLNGIFNVLRDLFGVKRTGAYNTSQAFTHWGCPFTNEELTRFLEVYRELFGNLES